MMSKTISFILIPIFRGLICHKYILGLEISTFDCKKKLEITNIMPLFFQGRECYQKCRRLIIGFFSFKQHSIKGSVLVCKCVSVLVC